MIIASEVLMFPGEVVLNGKSIFKGNITEAYRKYIGDYPKFFKMDALSKLGLVASEFLLRDIPAQVKENMGVIMFNSNSSLVTDRNYERTIKDLDNYFPSPALFVYTLPNIVTGEVCIRHKIMGESSFYVIGYDDLDLIERTVDAALCTTFQPAILAGYVSYKNEEDYLAHLRVYLPEEVEE